VPRLFAGVHVFAEVIDRNIKSGRVQALGNAKSIFKLGTGNEAARDALSE